MERDTENNHYYDHARKHDFNLGRFVSPDQIGGTVNAPQSWNRYSYSRSNPQKYVDPDGNFIDTVVDLAFIAYDLFDIGSSVIAGEGVKGGQLTALGADIAGAAIPFATGGGLIARAGSHADDAAKVGREAALQGEFSIRDWKGYPEGLPKPEGPFRVVGGEEYKTSRNAADAANKSLHRQDSSLKGKELHELKPVKFGGSPTDPKNKIALPPGEHRKVTTWWNKFMKSIKDYVDR
jgi:RHS repeat-associated protein